MNVSGMLGLAVSALMQLPGAGSGPIVTLMKGGGQGVPIRIAPRANDEEKAAAEELQQYLERMTGASWPVVRTQRQGVTIEVGRADRFGDVDLKALGPDGLLIEADGTGARLAGGDDRGTRYAATTFLEDLGVRWCMPGEFGEVVPKLSSVQVRAGRRIERPDFPFRQIWYAYGPQTPDGGNRLSEWCRRNKVGSVQVNHGHNLTTSLPKDVSLQTHPEYYALVKGKRAATQVCTTNPEVVRLITQRVIEYFDANPRVLAYSLCPDDNTEFCECERCRAMDVGGTDPYTRRPLVTDRYVHFLNAVARGIQDRHPGKMVTTYAYVNYSIPPQKVEIDPHVAVVFTTSVFCSIHGIGDVRCASRMKMKELLEEWTKKASQVYIYEYDPIPFNAELPCPLYGARMREMPVYKAMGIRGFTFESHQSWATLSPNYYISAKLMWDSGADGGALLEDYCRSFFGPAGQAMVRYYTAQEAAFGAYPEEIRWSLRDIPEAFNEAVVGEMGRRIKEAQATATEPPYRERVGMAAMAFEYLQRYLSGRRSGNQGTYETFAGDLKAARELIERMRVTNEDFILAKVAREYLDKSLDAVATEFFSKDMGMVTTWWLIGPFDNEGGKGHARVYPPEEAVDLNARYAGKGDEVRWRRHEMPAWRGYVDLTALMKPKDWVCGYGMVIVNSPDRRTAQFRIGSNDSVAVFLNGGKVLDRNVERLAKVDDDVVDVTLEGGRNVVLVKVGQTEGDWGWYFRITDAQGRAMKDLTYGGK